jgi:hypothetical protein
MEAHHDLRKSFTGFAVAQRCAVLSSGRDADGAVGSIGVTAQRRQGTAQHEQIVGRLTPRAGIESSMAPGSDQTAAEALQETETEVGIAGHSLIGVRSGTARAAVRLADGLTRRPESALRPESQPVRSCSHAGESMQLVEGWRSWELRWRK